MRSKKLAVAGVVSMAVAAAAAVPALAHEVLIFHGSDTARVYDVHTKLVVCDNEADGHGVRAHWRDANLNLSIGNWDLNGSDPGCSTPNTLPSNAIEFRLCENDVGCTEWTNK